MKTRGWALKKMAMVVSKMGEVVVVSQERVGGESEIFCEIMFFSFNYYN